MIIPPLQILHVFSIRAFMIKLYACATVIICYKYDKKNKKVKELEEQLFKFWYFSDLSAIIKNFIIYCFRKPWFNIVWYSTFGTSGYRAYIFFFFLTHYNMYQEEVTKRVQKSQIFVLLGVLITTYLNLILRQAWQYSRSIIQTTRIPWIQNWTQDQLEILSRAPPWSIQAKGHTRFLCYLHPKWELSTVFW